LSQSAKKKIKQGDYFLKWFPRGGSYGTKYDNKKEKMYVLAAFIRHVFVKCSYAAELY